MPLMKKILVTGAGGFVGKHLLNNLKKDYEIVAVDHKNPVAEEENITPQLCDISNKQDVLSLIQKHQPDIIFHLAAISLTWFDDPTPLFQVNVFGPVNIYEAVLTIQKDQPDYNPKIVYISSAEVYGKTKNLEDITEDDPFYPVNYYGSLKAAADRISYQYTQSKKLNIVIIRPFNHTGPGQQKGFFVPDMASQIAECEKGEKNEILVGNLDSIRDFMDVKDVIAAYRMVIEQDFPEGEAYNICSGQGIKTRDILDLLLSQAKKEIVVKQDPQKMRPSDTPIFIGNNHKFSSLTGWKPQFDTKQTFIDVLEYWRQQD